jgi:hypothetical protein
MDWKNKNLRELEPYEIEEALRENIKVEADIYATWRSRLSGEWGFYAGQLEEILKIKPEKWLEIRKKCKSDAQAQKKWEASELGQNEMIIKLRMKRLEKHISSLRQLIETAQREMDFA